ncbi:hypothetical protein ACWEOE_10760 [Amycolatopsis sp. NPDC004368]
MVWFFVDDNLAFHRKALKAGNTAMGLWVRAGSHCAQQLTDGFVEDEMVTTLGTTKQAERLVTSGLWTKVEGGYQFHQWSTEGRNPTRAEVLARRSRDAERKAKQRAKIYPNSEDAQVSGDRPRGTPGGVPGGVTGGVQTPSPHLPSKEEKKTSSSSSRAKRGTRIPDDFAVSADMVAWAREKTPHVDGRRETEKFINYWQAASGQKAVKRDWAATWRNWMLNAEERAPRMQQQRQPQSPTDLFAEQFLAAGHRPPELKALPGGAS